MGKAVGKSAKSSKTPDLFADAPKARRGEQPRCRLCARRRRRSRLYRQAHRGFGGARAGAPPPRHVYRRHRREGAASPVRRGHRQRHGRGAGRSRRLDRRRDGSRRLCRRHRQRPRHPGRSASEIQEQVGARSDHVHAARRRQIRLQGLRDLGRPARRRRLGGERAVRAHGGRGRARPKALQDGVRARQAEDQIARCGQGAEPPRHQGPLPAGPGDFRRQSTFQAGARVQDDALESLSVRRRRNPLVLRQRTVARRRRRAGESDLPFRRRLEGLSVGNAGQRDAGASRYFHGYCRQDRCTRVRSMGRGLDRRCRRLSQFVLQHHPDAGRRHSRVRPAHRADAGPERITPSASARASAPPRLPRTT